MPVIISGSGLEYVSGFLLCEIQTGMNAGIVFLIHIRLKL